MPAVTTCSLGSATDIRLLPSFSISMIEPPSAIRALAPDSPTLEARKRSRSSVRAAFTMRSMSSGGKGRSRTRSNRAAMTSLRLWIAGMTRCEGVSSASCRIHSPRSVSTGIMPADSRWALSPISSETIDLPLTTRSAPAASIRSVISALASSGVETRTTSAPAAVALAVKVSRWCSQLSSTPSLMAASSARRSSKLRPSCSSSWAIAVSRLTRHPRWKAVSPARTSGSASAVA